MFQAVGVAYVSLHLHVNRTDTLLVIEIFPCLGNTRPLSNMGDRQRFSANMTPEDTLHHVVECHFRFLDIRFLSSVQLCHDL